MLMTPLRKRPFRTIPSLTYFILTAVHLKNPKLTNPEVQFLSSGFSDLVIFRASVESVWDRALEVPIDAQ